MNATNLLACLVVLSMVVGCGGKPEAEQPAPATPFVAGMPAEEQPKSPEETLASGPEIVPLPRAVVASEKTKRLVAIEAEAEKLRQEGNASASLLLIAKTLSPYMNIKPEECDQQEALALATLRVKILGLAVRSAADRDAHAKYPYITAFASRGGIPAEKHAEWAREIMGKLPDAAKQDSARNPASDIKPKPPMPKLNAVWKQAEKMLDEVVKREPEVTKKLKEKVALSPLAGQILEDATLLPMEFARGEKGAVILDRLGFKDHVTVHLVTEGLRDQVFQDLMEKMNPTAKAEDIFNFARAWAMEFKPRRDIAAEFYTAGKFGDLTADLKAIILAVTK